MHNRILIKFYLDRPEMYIYDSNVPLIAFFFSFKNDPGSKPKNTLTKYGHLWIRVNSNQIIIKTKHPAASRHTRCSRKWIDMPHVFKSA